MEIRQRIRLATENRRRQKLPRGAFLGAALVLLGSVREARTEEEHRPALTLDAVYTGEVFGNARGGLRRATRYLDNLDLQATLDADAAFGWTGATFFVYGLYNNGRTFSEDVLGDAQVASNIETGVRAIRLYEAWWDQTVGDTSLRAGLYDLNSEFDAGDLRGLFLNSSHGIGQDYSQSGINGPSIFPSTSLSLRIHHQITPTWYVRAAALDAVPNDPAHPARTTIKPGDDGALLAAEAGYHDGATQLYVGYWRYTESFDELSRTDDNGEPRQNRENHGAYLMAAYPVFTEDGGETEGLSAFARFGVANSRINQFDHQISAGVAYTGLLPGRDEDVLGLAFSSSHNGNTFRNLQSSLGEPVNRRETNIELTYRGKITDWLTLQPNIQYIVNPGTDRSLKDALAIGVRFELSLHHEL